MITWEEKEPDFKIKPLSDLYFKLSLTTACQLFFNRLKFPAILITAQTRRAIYSHLSKLPIEMGGLLTGNVFESNSCKNTFLVRVENYVPAEEFHGTAISLEMSSSVWERARINSRGEFVVGWYHSHPNLGVFFSDTDRLTQKQFFYHRHSLGLVVDPIRKEERWFIGAASSYIPNINVITE
jgi:proteasome lid subunit RPN8/RPN11